MSTAVIFCEPLHGAKRFSGLDTTRNYAVPDQIIICIYNGESSVKSIFSAEIAFPWCIGPGEWDTALDIWRGNVSSFQELSLHKLLKSIWTSLTVVCKCAKLQCSLTAPEEAFLLCLPVWGCRDRISVWLRKGCWIAFVFITTMLRFLSRLLSCCTGALQIESSEESDQGKYECVATNNDGTRYSAPANLYVRGRKELTMVNAEEI